MRRRALAFLAGSARPGRLASGPRGGEDTEELTLVRGPLSVAVARCKAK